MSNRTKVASIVLFLLIATGQLLDEQRGRDAGLRRRHQRPANRGAMSETNNTNDVISDAMAGIQNVIGT